MNAESKMEFERSKTLRALFAGREETSSKSVSSALEVENACKKKNYEYERISENESQKGSL